MQRRVREQRASGRAGLPEEEEEEENGAMLDEPRHQGIPVGLVNLTARRNPLSFVSLPLCLELLFTVL
jgi:hypothetical protein